MKHISEPNEVKRNLIEHWSSFSYPGTEADIARVYAFRELDPQTATDEQVTAAFGDDTWRKACDECGTRGADSVEFANGTIVCGACICKAQELLSSDKAQGLLDPATPETPKRSLLSRIFG